RSRPSKPRATRGVPWRINRSKMWSSSPFTAKRSKVLSPNFPLAAGGSALARSRQRRSCRRNLMAGTTNVVMETSQGTITIELNGDAAPITVQNLLSYVDEGFYDGTIFHRVMPDFMIQGG